jgi:hypothetical protein
MKNWSLFVLYSIIVVQNMSKLASENGSFGY